MANREFYDCIIIGGGPGGMSAAIYALRASIRTVLIERGVSGGQVVLSDEVENYPALGSISGAELAQKFSQHAEDYNLEIVSKEVSELIPGLEHHTVRMADGEILKAYSVIVATGGSPRKLMVPGEDEYYGKGVSYCAVCDGFFFRNKTVAVVGGGDSAAEESLYLAKLASKVYVVHRRDKLRASMILQQRMLADPKIEILWNTTVEAILAENDGVAAVNLKDTLSGETRQLDTEGVFVFIGFDPNNELVPAGVKVNADGYVCTDEKCETAIPGIYAIGDLREKYARQIVVAAGDGCTAALAAAHFVEMQRSRDEM
ncbi:MAG: thioredoxin-disulfide reductase [Desulfobacterales bacterium]|nr:thioredoxin-disulfide reductase [Desulfobacterales bacterium]